MRRKKDDDPGDHFVVVTAHAGDFVPLTGWLSTLDVGQARVGLQSLAESGGFDPVHPTPEEDGRG